MQQAADRQIKKQSVPEKGLYTAGLCILAAIAVLIVLKYTVFPEFNILNVMRPCVLYSLTGFFCPGCGGTRSVIALVHGRFLVCAVNYPMLAYTVVMYLWFMFSQTIERISRGRIPIGLKWKNCYLWIAIGILAVHFVSKNIFYLLTGMDPFLT